jgi:hypothetical protein
MVGTSYPAFVGDVVALGGSVSDAKGATDPETGDRVPT